MAHTQTSTGIFPARSAPAFAALTLLISWKTFGISNVIASLGILVLLWAIADFSRASGRAIEGKLYAAHGGMPSITMFRRNLTSLTSSTMCCVTSIENTKSAGCRGT